VKAPGILPSRCCEDKSIERFNFRGTTVSAIKNLGVVVDSQIIIKIRVSCIYCTVITTCQK